MKSLKWIHFVLQNLAHILMFMSSFSRIRCHATPIRTISDAMNVNGIGEKLGAELMRALDKDSDRSTNATTTSSFSSSQTESRPILTDISSKSNISKSKRSSDDLEDDHISKRAKVYVPESGKGPWKVCICLSKLGGSSLKRNLAEKAIELGFNDIQDSLSRALSTLQGKGLVAIENKVVSFTEEGQTVAATIFDQYESGNQNIAPNIKASSRISTVSRTESTLDGPKGSNASAIYEASKTIESRDAASTTTRYKTSTIDVRSTTLNMPSNSNPAVEVVSSQDDQTPSNYVDNCTSSGHRPLLFNGLEVSAIIDLTKTEQFLDREINPSKQSSSSSSSLVRSALQSFSASYKSFVIDNQVSLSESAMIDLSQDDDVSIVPLPIRIEAAAFSSTIQANDQSKHYETDRDTIKDSYAATLFVSKTSTTSESIPSIRSEPSDQANRFSQLARQYSTAAISTSSSDWSQRYLGLSQSLEMNPLHRFTSSQSSSTGLSNQIDANRSLSAATSSSALPRPLAKSSDPAVLAAAEGLLQRISAINMTTRPVRDPVHDLYALNDPIMGPIADKVTILSPDDWEVVLLIDMREKDKNLIQNKLLESSVVNEVCTLSLGDFVFVARPRATKKLSEAIVLDAIIERKTFNDLNSSIIDGRYEEQKCRLRHCPIASRIYLIEGVSSTCNLSTKSSAMRTAMLTVLVSRLISLNEFKCRRCCY